MNGGWNEWSLWTTCTEACGGGTRYKTKLCNMPPPDHGGADCDGDTDSDNIETEVDACNTQPCKLIKAINLLFNLITYLILLFE